MRRKLSVYSLAFLLGIISISCNSEAEVATVSTFESTNVEAFSLADNEDLLANLDSVFFSIDLNNARIFNADSLPKGTDVSKLVVKISTSSVRGVDLIVSRVGRPDTVYNYLASQTDSIDFRRPVTLRITAQNGNTRDYQVKVNVHNMNPDSLSWSRSAYAPLPTSLSAPVAQKSVVFDNKAVTLTVDASGSACLAVADSPAGQWSYLPTALPANADVRSLTATASALFILDADGTLFTSPSVDGQWTPTGEKMHSLIGAFGDALLGSYRATDGSWTLRSYPSNSYPEMPAPAGFPVTGSSAMVAYSTIWSEEPTAVIVGGRTASGSLSGDTWAFDGTTWAKVNVASAIPAAEGVTLIPYFAYRTSNDWTVTRQSVLLAVGGRTVDGQNNRAVYVSRNRGITWSLAATTMHLPASIPSFAFADALVFDSTLSIDARSGSNWTEIADEPLPRWWAVDTSVSSRAVAPVTHWECPYIYLFGGVDADANLYPTIWRGVVNRLTFVPLY